MPEVWKDVLYPGRVRLADGREIVYDDGEPRRQHDRVKGMLADGLPIPFAWEHQPGVSVTTPWEALAAKAMGTMGHVKDARVDDSNALSLLLEVPDEEDFKRLPKVRFVSPQFEHDVVDGSGKKWPGRSLTHVAATARPIQHRQKPFSAEGLSAEWLSLASYAEGLAMADEKDDGGEKTGAGEGANLKALVEALRGAGLTIPDEVSTVDDLIIAVKASGGEKPEEAATAPETTTTEAGGPVMMSMEVKQELDMLKGELVKTKRGDLQTRVRALLRTGRVSRPVHDKLLAELGKEQLSLDRSGRLAGSRVLARVEAYEDLPAGNSFIPHDERLSADAALREVPPPDPEEDGKALREEGRKRGREMSAAAGKGGNGEE